MRPDGRGSDLNAIERRIVEPFPRLVARPASLHPGERVAAMKRIDSTVPHRLPKVVPVA